MSPPMRRPYPPLLLRVAIASAILWLLSRTVYVVVLIFGSPEVGMFSSADALYYAVHPAWLVRVVLVLTTAFLVHLDRRHAHELVLTANFGVSDWWFTGTSITAAALTDVVLQTVLRGVTGAS